MLPPLSPDFQQVCTARLSQRVTEVFTDWSQSAPVLVLAMFFFFTRNEEMKKPRVFLNLSNPRAVSKHHIPFDVLVFLSSQLLFKLFVTAIFSSSCYVFLFDLQVALIEFE